MATVTAKDVGEIYAKHGVLNSSGVYAEIAAIHLDVPVTDILDRSQEERQVLYRDAQRLMDEHGKAEDTEDGWLFHLANPIVGGNGVTIERLPVKCPSGRVIAHYGCPAQYRTGPALLRWQIATCADLPMPVIEALAVGDFLFITEKTGIHANADFALINT